MLTIYFFQCTPSGRTLRAAVAAAGGAATRTFGPALLARLLIFAHAVALHALHAPLFPHFEESQTENVLGRLSPVEKFVREEC